MTNRPGPLAQRIASELRAELGRQNMSRRALADAIDQSHVTVSRWVNGDGGMTFDALDSVCRVLGISVADLLARADQAVVPAPRPQRTRGGRRSGVVVGETDNSQGAGRDSDEFDARVPELAAA